MSCSWLHWEQKNTICTNWIWRGVNNLVFLSMCSARKRYKDQLKRQLAQAGISSQSWHQKASDRDSWHSSVRKASCKFKAERHKAAKEKHRRQKEWAASLPSTSQTFVCPKCSRRCTSRIGLYSHQQACKNWPSIFPTILVSKEWAITIIYNTQTANINLSEELGEFSS